MANEEEGGLKKAVKELLALEGIKLDAEEQGAGEFDALAGKSEKILEELNKKAEMMSKKLKMTPEEIDAYSSNPNNFSNAQWDALQKVKQEVDALKTKTRNTIGNEFLKEATLKQKEKGTKRLKKKKGWMQI